MGSQSQSGCFGQKSLAPTAIQSLDWTIHSSFSLHQSHYLDGLYELCCGLSQHSSLVHHLSCITSGSKQTISGD